MVLIRQKGEKRRFWINLEGGGVKGGLSLDKSAMLAMSRGHHKSSSPKIFHTAMYFYATFRLISTAIKQYTGTYSKWFGAVRSRYTFHTARKLFKVLLTSARYYEPPFSWDIPIYPFRTKKMLESGVCTLIKIVPLYCTHFLTWRIMLESLVQ